jgi:acetyl-CoA acetyltransferase family protein
MCSATETPSNKDRDVERALFTAGLRTPFGRAFKGAYKETRADDLLVELLTAQLAANPDLAESHVEDLLVGCAYPEGEQGFNVARMASLGAGLNTPGVTVNRLCASSLEVVSMAAARIAAGWGDVYLTAGIEAMSRIPRRGAGFSESDRIKATCEQAYINMGNTAEVVAQQYPQITRTQQEDLAAASHEKAHLAYEAGHYDSQLHRFLIERDEFIRYPANREKMASLPPAFGDDGTVTAATSSPLTDGATSGWVMAMDVAKELGVTSGLQILDSVTAHVEPEVMGLGPVPAMQKLFQRNKLQPNDIAAYEINEAFAIQVLASAEALNLPKERINAWGGAMALGHPLGASGLRLVMTLHDRLHHDGKPDALGIASLCVGGGQGMAMLFKYSNNR